MPESQYAHLGGARLMESTGSTLLTQFSIWRRAWLARRRPRQLAYGRAFRFRSATAGGAITSSVEDQRRHHAHRRIFLATADNTNSYTGDGASSILHGAGGVNPAGVITTLATAGGSVPFIPAQTTSATLPTGTSQRAMSCAPKGLTL